MPEVFDRIHDLREVPLSKRDFTCLRELCGARKGGTHDYATFLTGGTPSYKLAAQIDLDRFHGDEEHFLPWDDLIEEMSEADDRTPQERCNDQLALTTEKG